MHQWLPDYYVTDSNGHARPKAASTHEILLIVLIIEHSLVVIAGVIKNAIASTPGSVSVKIQRRQWLHEQEAMKARHQTTRRESAQIFVLSERTASYRGGDSVELVEEESD